MRVCGVSGIGLVVVVQIATVMQAVGDVIGNLTAFFMFNSSCSDTCSDNSTGAFDVRTLLARDCCIREWWSVVPFCAVTSCRCGPTSPLY